MVSVQSSLRSTHSIDALELLEEHESDADEGPAEHTSAEHVAPGRDLQLDLAHERRVWVGEVGVLLHDDLTRLDRVRPHADPLGLDSGIVGGETAQAHERLEGVRVTSNLAQPPRRVRQEPKADQHDDAGRHLQSEGQSVAPRVLDVPRSVGLSVSERRRH
jgi:hypothetical protein